MPTTGTVTITGKNFRPNEPLTLELDASIDIGPVNADGTGTVVFKVKVSDPAGDGSEAALLVGPHDAVIYSSNDYTAETSFTVTAPAAAGGMPRLGSDVA